MCRLIKLLIPTFFFSSFSLLANNTGLFNESNEKKSKVTVQDSSDSSVTLTSPNYQGVEFNVQLDSSSALTQNKKEESKDTKFESFHASLDKLNKDLEKLNTDVESAKNLKGELDSLDKRIAEHTTMFSIFMSIVGAIAVLYPIGHFYSTTLARKKLDKELEDLHKEVEEYRQAIAESKSEIESNKKYIEHVVDISNSVDIDISTLTKVAAEIVNFNFKMFEHKLDYENKLSNPEINASKQDEERLFQEFCLLSVKELRSLDRSKVTLIEHLNSVENGDLNGVKPDLIASLKRQIQRICFIQALGFRKVKDLNEAIRILKEGLCYSYSQDSDALLQYNLACYYCLTDKLEMSMLSLKQALKANSDFIQDAMADSDLKQLIKHEQYWNQIIVEL